MCMLASFAFQMFAAETLHVLRLQKHADAYWFLYLFQTLLEKAGFGSCHSGNVEIEAARDLTMCFKYVAFSGACCLFAFGCVLEYLPDAVLEL